MRGTIRWIGPSLGLILSLAVLGGSVASAQTWTGASGTTNNWSDGTNWSSTPTAPANNGSALILYSNSATVPRTTSTVDVNYDINTLTFQAGALGYVIDNSGGSTLTIEGGITDSATTTETINAPVILGTTNSFTQTWTVDGTQLNVNGPITAGAGFTGFIKTGSGILQLGSGGATNNFGPITVSQGTLQQSAAGALPDVNYTINGTGTLNFNNFDATVGTINQTAGAVELGGASSTVTMGAVTQSGGTFDLNGGTAMLPSLTQTGGTFSTDGGTATIADAVSQNNAGTTSTFNVNGGSASIGTTLMQSNDSAFNVTAGGTATVTGAVTQSDSSNISVTGAGSSIAMNGGLTQNNTTAGTGVTIGTGATATVTGNVTQNNASSFTSAGTTTISGNLTQSGTATFGVNGGTASAASLSSASSTTTLALGTGTFTDNNASDQTYAGNITSSGGTFVLGNGTNTHTLILTGNNQAGFNGGTIDITANSTLQAGTTAASNATALPTANYTVDGTLNANGNSFTTTGLTGAASGNITLGAGTMTINETTGGPFTYSGTINGTTGAGIVTATTNTQTQTLGGVISGATSITANGGVLTLTGNNTYTGGTMLNTGGTVAITEDDAGVTNLGDASSTLTFNGGTLQINGTIPTGFNPARTVTFTSLGGGIDAQDMTEVFTVSQNITGGGPLNINPNNGLGTIVLTGPANSYGTTNINSGTLQIGNGTTTGSLGTGPVTDSGNLVIDPAAGASQSISNSINGTGTMEISGTNTTVTLSGSNALTGATTIDASDTLKGAVGNIPGDVIANGTLDFTQATNATYSNTITGSGNVIKDGAGTLTLSATNNYGGTTTVNAGGLEIDGTTSSGGGVTVEAPVTNSTTVTGGTLSGIGTVGTVGTPTNINNFGVVSPGNASNPEGTLTQVGNFTNEPSVANVPNTGTFVVNVNGPPAAGTNPGNSELNVTGGATLTSGSTVQVNISGNTYLTGVDYTAIATTTGATNNGATFKTNRIFVKATYDPTVLNDIDFILSQSFVGPANTFNQTQVANYLTNNATNTNADFVALTNALNSITSTAQARAALTQLTGDIHPTMAQINVNDTNLVIGQVAERLRASNFVPGGPLGVADNGSPAHDGNGNDDSMKLLTGKTPIAFVGCDDNGMPTFAGGDDCGSHWSAWGIGFGMGGSSEFDGNATAVSYGTGGIVAGMERWEDDCHLLGFYGAYVGSNIDAINGQNATMNGGQFGGYMFGDDGFNYYTVLGGFEFDGDTTNRQVSIGTTPNVSGEPTANYDDWQSFLYAERGMSFEECNYVLQPFVGVQYIYVRQNGFTESGPTNTALDLIGNSDSTNSLRSIVGARWQYAMVNHGGLRTLPELHAMWLHEYLDADTRVTATMVPVGGTPFIVQGLDMGRDWALFGGNFTWEMLNGWSMFVNYDLQVNGRMAYNVGSGGLGFRW